MAVAGLSQRAHLQILDAGAAQRGEQGVGVCGAGDDRPVGHVAGAELRGRLGQDPAVAAQSASCDSALCLVAVARRKRRCSAGVVLGPRMTCSDSKALAARLHINLKRMWITHASAMLVASSVATATG